MKLLMFLLTAFTISYGKRHIDLRNIVGVPVEFTLPEQTLLDPEDFVIQALFFKELSNFREQFESKETVDRLEDGDILDNSPCQSDTYYLLSSLSGNRSIPNQRAVAAAAYKFIDSAAKFPSSILSGNWLWTGDYRECQSVETVYNIPAKRSFKGKYFEVAFTRTNGSAIFGQQPNVAGFCFPDTCVEADVTNLVNKGLFILNIAIKKELNKTVDIAGFAVYEDKENKVDTGAITFIVITGVLCLLVLVSTVVDYFLSKEQSPESKTLVPNYDEPYGEQDDRAGLLSNELFSNDIQGKPLHVHFVNGKLLEFCKAFSLYSNSKKLFGTKTADGPLACLNGLRVLSMWWVILGHSYVFVLQFLEDQTDILTLITRFTFQPIVNGTFSVDSFFFLSGLLVAYLAFKELSEKGSLNWFYFVIHRYWRLTPLYAFVIFYYAYVMKYTISGPFSLYLDSPQGFELSMNQCKKYWWTNLLYINNFYPEYGSLKTMCLGWGWYLANDMQFYLVLGPLIVILLWLNKYAGLCVAIFLTLVCIATRVGIVVYYGIYEMLQATPTKHTEDVWAKSGALYQRPYARWSVYIVGMLLGYILAKTSNRIRIHRLLALLGWCVATASGLAVIYGLYYYNKHILEQVHMTLTESAFYISLCRTVWAMCLAWVVLACVSGNGSIVKDILSWKVWAPLGRLTYAAYLVHPIVIYTYLLNLPSSVPFSDLSLIYMFVSNLVLSYAIAFCVSMLVEAPMIQLEKLVLIPLGRLMIPLLQRVRNKVLSIPVLRRNRAMEE